MLIEKPIAFESLDFLPGFPTLSKYTCNPWGTNFRAGACANPPQAVGRERMAPYGFDAMVQAIKAAGGVVPNYSGKMLAGLGAAEHALSRHIRHEHFMSGMGGGEHGGAHHGRSGAAGYEGNWPTASTSRNDHPNYKARLSGCGCGGSCSSCSGMGAFDATSIMSWITSNWMPLAIGAGAVWFLKRR